MDESQTSSDFDQIETAEKIINGMPGPPSMKHGSNKTAYING